MINNQPNEITLIYNSDKANDRKAKLFVETFQGHKVKLVDLTKKALTEAQLTELSDKMKVNIEDLLDPTYDDHISVHREGLKIMGRKEMLTLMTHDSKLINTPLFVIGNHAYNYGSAYSLVKAQLANTSVSR